jgi:hypothetical protein
MKKLVKESLLNESSKVDLRDEMNYYTDMKDALEDDPENYEHFRNAVKNLGIADEFVGVICSYGAEAEWSDIEEVFDNTSINAITFEDDFGGSNIVFDMRDIGVNKFNDWESSSLKTCDNCDEDLTPDEVEEGSGLCKKCKNTNESSINESYNENNPSPEAQKILDELRAEWKPFNVEVDIVEESDEPDNYGYGESSNPDDYYGEDDEDRPADYVEYLAFSFGSSTDDKMDEKVEQLGLEVVIDSNGDAFGQWWYDASPIFTGSIQTLASDVQPWPVASPEEVLEEISGEFEEDEE